MSFWPYVILTLCPCDLVILTLCHFDLMSFWPYVILTLCHFDLMSIWPKVTLTKSHFDQKSFWPNIIWPNVIFTKCHFDQMSLWHNSILYICHVAQTSFWTIVTTIHWHFKLLPLQTNVISSKLPIEQKSFYSFPFMSPILIVVSVFDANFFRLSIQWW